MDLIKMGTDTCTYCNNNYSIHPQFDQRAKAVIIGQMPVGRDLVGALLGLLARLTI